MSFVLMVTEAVVDDMAAVILSLHSLDSWFDFSCKVVMYKVNLERAGSRPICPTCSASSDSYEASKGC